jgi:hypothetical protein
MRLHVVTRKYYSVVLGRLLRKFVGAKLISVFTGPIVTPPYTNFKFKAFQT